MQRYQPSLMNIIKQLIPTKCRLGAANKSYKGTRFFISRSFHDSSVEVLSQEQEVAIALGSNVGDRLHNFDEALERMKKSGIDIKRHGCLYETEPAYVTDQPCFLNSAVMGTTKLGPFKLLEALKKIERDMGRTDGIRYGPRPIDLDILFYGNQTLNTDILTVPHERIWERPFVLGPLVDLLGPDIDSNTIKLWHSFSKCSGGLVGAWEKLGGESLVGKDGMRRVLPVGGRFWNWSSKTSIMGVLNVTPDSFSDGGKFSSVDLAVSRVRSMISEGADMIDIGAQSTRPMASRISPEEEMDRLIPVLEAVKDMPEIEGKILSVDTFYSRVASEAVSKGAHLVNDVSGGQLDPNMFNAVAALKVPYIDMHMRGNPTTMQNSKNLEYGNVCKDVAYELYTRARDAELSGIPAWRIIMDPGIGFSKGTEHNLDILIGSSVIRGHIARWSYAMSHVPIVIGPSRKKFLGEVCDRAVAVERDPATVASVTAGVLNGANIVRVHNVRDNRDAVKLCDALLERRKENVRVGP